MTDSAARGAWNAASDMAKPKVLAVDDVDQNLKLLRVLLEDVRCEFLAANSGQQALALVEEHEFAVLLLDVNMPGMDGYAVAERVRQLPNGKELPIVFITASDPSDQGMLRGYDSGAVDYLFKPVQREILRSKVRVFTELHERQHQIAQARDDLQRSNVELQQLAMEKDALAEEARLVAADLARAYANLQSTQAQLVQSAKMAALGELVAGMAHEINNPLCFSIGHLDTARRGLTLVRSRPERSPGEIESAWEKVDDRLQQLSNGLNRINDLMGKLQTFARHREGDFRRVSINACIDAVVALVRHRLEERIDVVLQLDQFDLLSCYPTLLNEAMMSLVQNAIESIPASGSIIIATTFEHDYCVIRIIDTGRGIAPEIRDRVMEPFFTTKPVGRGEGLGLPVAYSIARRHGGTLELLPNLPHGTDARLRIPLDVVPDK